MVNRGGFVKKTISMSIRVSEEELEKLKVAASLQEYSSYSEFVRRTALIEAGRIIRENLDKGGKSE
jgi:uncharacterized protein (DUF1778 family)